MKKKLVLIGASTGGPGHLKIILSELPNNLSVPIIVAQHMGRLFIPSFIEQFANEFDAPVYSLEKKRDIDRGGIYICEENMRLFQQDGLKATSHEETTIYNPSVDVLFSSATLLENYEILAILLTGIGDDGAKPMFELAKKGARVIGENEESSVVFGMPKKAKEINDNLPLLSLLEIKEELKRFANVF